MPKIALDLLEDDPRNSNVCPPDVLEKLRKNIEQTGLYPPLIIRPKSKKSERFIIIDGHHRKRVLEALGHSEAECHIWSVSGKEALIALATLNTLRGTDNLKKRAELLHNLAEVIPIDTLAQFIPEAAEEIRDLLKFLEEDTNELEQAIQKQLAQEQASLSVPLTFLIPASDMPLIEKTLSRFQDSDRGIALVNLCTYATKQLELQPNA